MLALVEAARAAGAARVILSGEDFAIHEDLGWLAPVAARHEVEAVFYLRRQDHWLASWYNQHVKWPFDRVKSRLDPQAFLATIEDFHWLDYERLLGRWSAALGEGRVAVAVLEKGQVEDAAADLLARAGIDPIGLDLDAERVNDSLPVHMLEIARHLGLFELKGGKRTRLLNALRERPRRPGAGAAGRDRLLARGAQPGARPLRRLEPGGGAALPRARGAVPRAAARARTRPTGAFPSSRATRCSTTGSRR